MKHALCMHCRIWLAGPTLRKNYHFSNEKFFLSCHGCPSLYARRPKRFSIFASLTHHGTVPEYKTFIKRKFLYISPSYFEAIFSLKSLIHSDHSTCPLRSTLSRAKNRLKFPLTASCKCLSTWTAIPQLSSLLLKNPSAVVSAIVRKKQIVKNLSFVVS